ncbi:MAG: histidinol-phosphate transaminase [Planctomycetota bacterium]
MHFSRREFVAGVSSAASLAMAGLAGEIRADAAEADGGTKKVARILFNENPLGPSPKALAAIADAGQQFARYPLGESGKLSTALRRANGLPFTEPTAGLSLRPADPPPGNMDLILGVGSSEVLRAAAWAYCSGGGNVVEAYPGYAAIGGTAARIPGAQVDRKMIPLTADYRLDRKAMIDAIDSDTKLVVICNPNNPTGTTIDMTEIESIAMAAPDDALVFVDEAYIEFAADPKRASALEFAKTRENVLVTRTFSKIYGLAGLRVGYGIGSRDVIERLKPHMLGGLAFNMPGILAAQAAIEDQDHLQATLALNEKIHESWRRSFKGFGFEMSPSVTCFGWVNVGQDCTPLVQYLAGRDVLISGGQRWDLPNYVRISIGTEEENDRLLAGIKSFLAG